MTINTLVSKHDIKKIDLLVIDTMGFDFEILKMFPFDTIKPSIIHFKHSLLPPEDHIACFKQLTSLRYGLTQVSVDTIAYLNAPIRQASMLCLALYSYYSLYSVTLSFGFLCESGAIALQEMSDLVILVTTRIGASH